MARGSMQLPRGTMSRRPPDRLIVCAPARTRGRRSRWARMVESRRALVLASLAVAVGEDGPLRRALADAAAASAAAEVEEVLLQSYLFLGYPAALRAFGVWRAVSGRAAPAPRDDEGEWPARGERTCSRVYGGQYGRLRSNVAALHPDLERWMIVEGYGKVLGRPGLDLATRELCIVALLAVQDAAPQLYSHLRGALNAGAAAADVEETMALILPQLAQRRRDALIQQWAAVRRSRGLPEK
jgi:4-carboxymuconolactone decarboxylase